MPSRCKRARGLQNHKLVISRWLGTLIILKHAIRIPQINLFVLHIFLFLGSPSATDNNYVYRCLPVRVCVPPVDFGTLGRSEIATSYSSWNLQHSPQCWSLANVGWRVEYKYIKGTELALLGKINKIKSSFGGCIFRAANNISSLE